MNRNQLPGSDLYEVFHLNTKLLRAVAPSVSSQALPDVPIGHRFPLAERVSLPPPLMPKQTFRDVVAQRVSVRSWSTDSMTLGQLSTMLYDSCASSRRGSVSPPTVDQTDRRPAPSAGALYPIETYIVTQHVSGVPSGLYYYDPLDHALETLSSGSVFDRLVAASAYPEFLHNAACVVLLSAVFGRTTAKYSDRGYRYVLLEAGHIGQALSLSSAALGLGSLSFGGFYDADVEALIGMDGVNEALVYGLIFGMPLNDAPDTL